MGMSSAPLRVAEYNLFPPSKQLGNKALNSTPSDGCVAKCIKQTSPLKMPSLEQDGCVAAHSYFSYLTFHRSLCLKYWKTTISLTWDRTYEPSISPDFYEQLQQQNLFRLIGTTPFSIPNKRHRSRLWYNEMQRWKRVGTGYKCIPFTVFWILLGRIAWPCRCANVKYLFGMLPSALSQVFWDVI